MIVFLGLSVGRADAGFMSAAPVEPFADQAIHIDDSPLSLGSVHFVEETPPVTAVYLPWFPLGQLNASTTLLASLTGATGSMSQPSGGLGFVAGTAALWCSKCSVATPELTGWLRPDQFLFVPPAPRSGLMRPPRTVSHYA